MRYMLRLHGDYHVSKGQRLKVDTHIGTANGHKGFAPHDHFSILRGDNQGQTINGMYGTKPWVIESTYKYIPVGKNANDRYSFNQNAGLGGYDYLEQTQYDWYLGTNPTLHDGLDLYAPLGSDLYSGVSGKVSDVGFMANGTSYLIVVLDGWQKYENKWCYLNNNNWVKNDWLKDNDTWFKFDNQGYLDSHRRWEKFKGKWMFNTGVDGWCTNGTFTIDGKKYNFDHNGYML